MLRMQEAAWTIFFIRSRQVRKHLSKNLSLIIISSNKLYHPKCSVKCTACKALIGAEEYVKLGEFSFHWNCYKCQVGRFSQSKIRTFWSNLNDRDIFQNKILMVFLSDAKRTQSQMKKNASWRIICCTVKNVFELLF